ncbi:HVO_A0114 family putative DNA-binding protein [Haloferax gibbonsii]|uniref:HVO_A0114 family putative DNA-binding protein n=1 Tax=Haloferax gibbonsii TaxID=35746 RepID=UPI0009E2FD2E|nr:helix-turn-helix domain-containing protein [Haloferax gibbonsii]
MDDKPPASKIPLPTEFTKESIFDSDLELRNTFSEILSQHGFADTLVLSRGRADDVFHDRRIEIVEYLQTHEPRSVRALASELTLDKGVVSRDLQKLVALDIVEFDEDGQSKAPRLKHRHVVVEPIY